MTEPTPSFFVRFFLALRAFWRTLVDADFARSLRQLSRGEAALPKPKLEVARPDAALQLLGLLQREGRLVDFLEEDVAQYSDAEIGAAVRVVHEGCRKALREHLSIEPVRSEPEGSRITLEPGFDAALVRLTGNVVGEPPFTGSLAHRGWRVADVRLPQVVAGHDLSVLVPAEVEL